MTPFTTLQSVAAPLLRDNIDTDIIIRVEPLFGGVPRDELGPHAFRSWRYDADGHEDAGFVLNRPPYRDARILLAGANFGCGSSREGAVWALMAMGIRCVIAPSFGDIFHENCFQNGLLPVRMPRADVERLAALVEADPARSLVTVDLLRCVVNAPDGRETTFEIPALRREALLEGLDAIDLTRKREAAIDAYEARDARARPWIYAVDDDTKET